MSLFYYLQNDLTFASKNIDGHIFAQTSQEQIDGTSAYRKTGQFYFLDIIRKDWVPKDHFPFVSADLKPKTSPRQALRIKRGASGFLVENVPQTPLGYSQGDIRFPAQGYTPAVNIRKRTIAVDGRAQPTGARAKRKKEIELPATCEYCE